MTEIPPPAAHAAAACRPAACRLRFEDKVAMVTGGTQGIGEGVVRVFVKNGAKVVFCGKELDKGRCLEAELNQSGPGEACFVECDLTKEEDIKNLVEQAVMKYGRIDCLVNNAGWHPPEQSIDDISADDFRKLIELNLIGYFLTSKYSLPHIRKTHGCIINNSSLVQQIGQYHAIPYVATKGAVSAMTRAMAVDEAENHVRVNTFSTSSVYTPLFDSIADSMNVDRQKFADDISDCMLMGRNGTSEEIGELCLFLAAEGTFMTGADIPVTGGAELDYGVKTKLKKSPQPDQ